MEFVTEILRSAANQGSTVLNEADCYKIFNRLGLKTPKVHIIGRGDEIKDFLPLFEGDKIVIKVLSGDIIHKTEKGGVKICPKESAGATFADLKLTFREAQTFMLCQYVQYSPFTLGREILLGARYDKAFGPLVMLGAGGTNAEDLSHKLKPAVSPSIIQAADADFEEFIKKSFVWDYTGGLARGSKPCGDIKELVNWVAKISFLTLYFSQPESPFIIEEVEINPLVAADGKFIALDGVLRFRENKFPPARPAVTKEGIKALLEPKTIAVAGVSGTKINMGRIILRNIKEAGFDVKNLYVIKKDETAIDSAVCVESCQKLPVKIDTLVVTVPAQNALDVLKDAALSGKVNGVVLISGGIGEKEGSQGIKQQVDDLIKTGKELNPAFTLNGSNSLGMVSNPANMNTLFIPKDKFTPPLGADYNHAPCAFISQSGAFVISALSKMEEIKPVYSVMTGNQLDVSVTDYVEYLAGEEKIKTILLYIEGFKEGEGARLKKAVAKLKEQGKTAVIYLAGRTQAGQKAVMGHTASIAGDYISAKILLGAEGALMADNFEDFISLSRLACCAVKPKNNKVFMISNAGFESSGMADNITADSPVCALAPCKELEEELKEILARYSLNSLVDVRNPFDVTPMCGDEAVLEIVEAAAKSGKYGAVLFSTIPLSPAVKTLKEENPYLMQKLAQISRTYKLPVIISVSAGSRFDYYRDSAKNEGLCVFTNADDAVRKLALYLQSL